MSARKRIWCASVCAVALACAGAPVAAQSPDRGAALYENHCETCHEAWAHTRTTRKARSLEELRARVAAWSVHAGLGWDAEEVEDVTAYLNAKFYHYE